MKKFLVSVLALVLAFAVCAGAEQIGNPWLETDPEGMCATIGAELGEPENAEDVVWYVNTDLEIGEMDCVIDGVSIMARVCTACAEAEDIAGMYFEWTVEEAVTVSGIEGVYQFCTEDDTDYVVVQWYDVVPGIMYAVCAVGDDLADYDIVALAEQVYIPMQGEA